MSSSSSLSSLMSNPVAPLHGLEAVLCSGAERQATGETERAINVNFETLHLGLFPQLIMLHVKKTSCQNSHLMFAHSPLQRQQAFAENTPMNFNSRLDFFKTFFESNANFLINNIMQVAAFASR